MKLRASSCRFTSAAAAFSLCKIQRSTKVSLPVGYILISLLSPNKKSRLDLSEGLWHEFLIELQHCELCGIVELVTELPVALNAEDLEVDVATLCQS